MAIFLQVVVTGVAAGAVYGVVAISLTLIYRLSGVVHFALGELIALSVFASLFFVAGTRPVSRAGIPLARLVPALAGGLAIAVASSYLVYAVAVAPFLRRGSTLGWVGGVVAVAFAVRGFLAASFVRPSYVLPDPLPFHRLPNGGLIRLSGGVVVHARSFFVAGVGVGLAALAAWVLSRTRWGTALRAIAEDRNGAGLIGLPTWRLLGTAFAGAGGLAALAALVAAPSAPVGADTGALIGLKGLVAALAAGFGSPWSALAGGLAVGLIESGVASVHLGPLHLGPQYRDVVPLVLAVVALLLARRRAGAFAE